jgi:hypothetical protein
MQGGRHLAEARDIWFGVFSYALRPHGFVGQRTLLAPLAAYSGMPAPGDAPRPHQR